MLKRGFDLLVSVLAAPFVVVVCLFICMIYIIFEREYPLFVQLRVGRNEKKFKMLKLRTMKISTAEKGTHQIDRNAVTTVGKLLRATKLDELPQLWNVLLGQMSLVGPRPGLPIQADLTRERRNLDVYAVRPGITGASQVDGIDMSDPKELAESDAMYIKNSSFLYDLKILMRTVLGQGQGDRIK